MSNNYGEILCQATEILAQHLIDKVSYDQTILCTIMDDSEKDSGKYRVSSGEAIFDAYTSDTSLRKNHQVYVSIPSGDWNEQKLIVAKKTTDSNEPITYKDPFDSFVNITNNLITSNIDSKGLVANDPQEGENHRYITLWTYNRPDIINALSKNSGEVLGGYTRLAISANFKAWLKSLNAVKGDYGLQLQIETEPEDSADGSQAKTETKYCIFSSKQMIGNPFNFESFYSQKKIFDISSLKNIKSMVLYFYQESGSFVNGKGELIPYENRPANIFVKDVIISLGYDAESFEDDSLIIYTLNSQKYDIKKSPLSDNHKELHVRWIHKFDDGKIRVVQPEDDIDYQLNWYRQELGVRSHTVWSGVDWAPLSSQISKDGNIEYAILDLSWSEYNTTASTIADDPIRKLSYNQSWLLPDTTLAEEKIKVVLTYGSEVIYSDILTFSNVDEVASKATMDAIQALSIKCEDNSFGNYLIYDLGGNILDNAESRKIREFRAYFNSAQDTIDDNELAQLTEANTIEWIIPTKNTMIEIEDYVSGNIKRNYIDENGYQHIFRFGANKYDPKKNSITSGDADITNQNSQRYKINSHYDNSKTDNTIKCVVTKNGVQYTTIKELTFGPAGTSGTNYTFVIDFISNDSALTLKSDFADGEIVPAVIARARLYDYTGKEIPNLETKDIEWSIRNKDDKIISNNNFVQLYPVKEENAEKEEYIVKNKIELQLLDTVEEKMLNSNYTILEAILRKSDGNNNGWGDYDLHAYLPIPIRASRKYPFISGATTIFYNSLGELDSFYQDPYILYYKENDEADLIIIENSTWDILSDEGKNDPYIPKMSSGQSGYKLVPLNFYVENSVDNICVVGYNDEQMVWSQPIYITQNKYPSSILNQWNGQLIIDEENNAIFAAKIAAGKKDKDDNTFSGVMMGDWSGKEVVYETVEDPDDSTKKITRPKKENGATVTEIAEHTGIYGFQKGVASFGFRDDGTAFIGKPGAGRLEFNGDKSIIESNAFASGLGGLSLDFDEGVIEMYEPGNKHDTKKSIILDAKATETPFTIGDKFEVNWDGSITARNGTFTGTIYARDGSFKGTITSSSIDSSTITSTKISAAEINGGRIFGSEIVTDKLYAGTMSGFQYDRYTREDTKSEWVKGDIYIFTNDQGDPYYPNGNADTALVKFINREEIPEGSKVANLGTYTGSIVFINQEGKEQEEQTQICGIHVEKGINYPLSLRANQRVLLRSDSSEVIIMAGDQVSIWGKSLKCHVHKDEQEGIYARFA